MMSAATIKAFLLAGNATFTIDNGTGRHLTFRIWKTDPQVGSRFTTPAYFVSVSYGQAGDSYIGMIDQRRGTVKLTKGSKVAATSQAFVVISWALRIIWAGRMLPAPASLLHAGSCGRCGRELTDPESIARGIGPDCWEQMGGGRVLPFERGA